MDKKERIDMLLALMTLACGYAFLIYLALWGLE
jgi:hypothetical protein